jgi:lysyl-tRNA synthetase class 2
LKSGVEARNPYPHKFNVTHTHKEFINEFSHLKKEEWGDKDVSIAGRLMNIRNSSKKMAFLDVYSEG